jgi:putative salt-induced outer membrane protein YdiY
MRIAGIALAVLLLAGTATADIVTLTNGDRLTGEIVSLEDGKLVLRTTYASEVTIDRDQVADIASGEDLAARIAAGMAAPAETAGAPLGAKSAVEKEIEDTPWKGKLAIGGLWTEGNTERLGLNVSATVVRETADDKFTAKASYDYAEEDGDKVTDRQAVSLRQDVKFDPWYVFGILEGMHDEFQDLDIRATLTLGAGRVLADSEDFKASLDLGATLVFTDYETEDSEWSGEARIGFNAEKAVFDSAKITQDLALYPSITDGGEFRLVSETAFEQPLSEAWFFRLSVLNLYDSNAPDDIDEHDLEVRLSLVYNF